MRADSWVLLLVSFGAFQWPRVLCGSDEAFGVIEISSPVAESRNLMGSSGGSCIMCGLPLGLNSNRRTWNEHFLSSSLPPVHQRRSFHCCASDCIRWVMVRRSSSRWGWKSLYVPVLSSTNPTMEIWTDSSPSGLVKDAPWDIDWWISHNVDEINSHMAGELPLPCPLP